MITGKTKTGFEYSIDERALTDRDLLKAIRDFDAAGNKIKQITALDKIIGLLLRDNEDRLMEHIASLNDGYKPIDKIYAEVYEMINNSDKIKNSSSSHEQ